VFAVLKFCDYYSLIYKYFLFRAKVNLKTFIGFRLCFEEIILYSFIRFIHFNYMLFVSTV